MDVLSEVLKVVKLQGAMFYNGEFSSPWSFCSPPSATIAPKGTPLSACWMARAFLVKLATPPFPQRTSNGLPHALAIAVGGADASLDQLLSRTDRIRSRL